MHTTAKRLGRLALLAALGASALGACNEESNPYEEISKLRTLGVATTPVVGAPVPDDAPVPPPTPAFGMMTLTVYAAVPTGETVTAEGYLDEQAKYSVPLPAIVVPGSETYTELNAFRLYSVQATVPLPKASEFIPSPDQEYARVRYGVRLTSGDEEEVVVGDFLVYPADAAEQAWTAPSLDITSPAAGESVGDTVDLEATLEPTNDDEPQRIGWFVSGGAIRNRRAKETEWETGDSGPGTVVLTTRGRKSGAFALKTVDVTVE